MRSGILGLDGVFEVAQRGIDIDGLRHVLNRLPGGVAALEGGAAESFDYGPGRIPEEHLFVPRPGGRSEDDGWLIGTVLDWKKGVTGLSAFDARAVAAGPIAQAWLPYPLPLGFHGAFVGG